MPRDKITARYQRVRANVKVALTFVDFAIAVDNSSLDTPLRPVASLARGRILSVEQPLAWWANEVLPAG